MSPESAEVSCAQCGYDLRGNADPTVCPECGFASEGESFEFGHRRSRWFIPLTAVGWLAVLLLFQVEASHWLILAALVFLIGLTFWETLAKRRRTKAQILVNTTGFRVVNTASPRGRWVTWDKVVGVNASGLVNIIFIGVRDPDSLQIQVGPMKNAKQRDEVRAAIDRYRNPRHSGERAPTH